MIHTVVVGPDTGAAALRKEYRKCLMTGGAVVRLESSLDPDALGTIVANFGAEASEGNLAADVLVEVAKHPALDEAVAEELARLDLRRVNEILEVRGLARNSIEVRWPQDQLLREEEMRITNLSDMDLRRYFLNHLGDSAVACLARLALCRRGALPEDLSYLLERDRDERVRFHARYQKEVSGTS